MLLKIVYENRLLKIDYNSCLLFHFVKLQDLLQRSLFSKHSFFVLKGGPQLEQRFESYYNYCNLFNYILSEYKFSTSKFY